MSGLGVAAVLAVMGASAPPDAGSVDAGKLERSKASPQGPLEGTPYDGFQTLDAVGRVIQFYVSRPKDEPTSSAQPLVVFIQGSGCEPLFTKKGKDVYGGLQNIALEAVKHRARVLAVEKPGVAFGVPSKTPGSAEGCSAEFLEEYTLARWAEANDAALRAALTLPGVEGKRVLVMGHSEGADVAAKVAALDARVTHVACLAGAGPTQLFDFTVFARAEGPDAMKALLVEWAAVQADPLSTTKFWRGHPHRRWTTFMQESPLESLLATRARIYLAHGTKDTSVPVVSFDVAYAELLARGRDVTAERLEGADHSFKTSVLPGYPKELEAVMGRVVNWYLGAK